MVSQSPVFPCPSGLIELRNQVRREIDEESASSHKYILAAGKLAHFKMSAAAEKFRMMAADELAHRAVLEAVVDIITTNCEE